MAGGAQPVWARNGREFFYQVPPGTYDVSLDGQRFLMIKDVEPIDVRARSYRSFSSSTGPRN